MVGLPRAPQLGHSPSCHPSRQINHDTLAQAQVADQTIPIPQRLHDRAENEDAGDDHVPATGSPQLSRSEKESILSACLS